MVRRHYHTADERTTRQLSEEARQRLDAQRRRRYAYEHGLYELEPDEGYRCPHCNWRSLSAQIAFDDDTDEWLASVCGDCGQTFDADTSRAHYYVRRWTTGVPEDCEISVAELDRRIESEHEERYSSLSVDDS